MGGTFTFPLRWVDLDAQGHVNNTLVVDYMQEARVRYFLGTPAAGLLDDGVVVVAHQVEYRAPISFTPDPIAVALNIDYVGGSKVGIAYELVHGGQIVAVARTLLCAFDFDAGRPRRLPAVMREFLLAEVQPAPELRPLGGFEVGERHHLHELWVRWSDQDRNGHLNNVRFFDFIAEARVHMTTDADTSATRMSAAAEAGYLWLVVRQDLEYLSQMAFRITPYQVRTSVAKVGRTSLTLVAEIIDPDAGTLFARSHTVLVCADISGRPTDLPAVLKENLGAFSLS